MQWIGRALKSAAETIAKHVNKSKSAAKPAQKPPQKAVKPDKQKQQAAAKKQKEKTAYEDAKKAREELKEKGGGSYHAEETKGHDGSRPNTPSPGNDNSNSGGDYDPPREPPPRSSYRGKAKDKGRSL
jgi:hypothetical protein